MHRDGLPPSIVLRKHPRFGPSVPAQRPGAQLLIQERETALFPFGCDRKKANKSGRFLAGAALVKLILLFTSFLATAFARERFLDSFLFARFQVKGVTFHFLDDVFLLNLAFETAQRILEGLTLLKSDLCQLHTPPNLSGGTK